ncbi:MAG: serine/threonine-protein phosphatase [Solirubrobacterales bacterium]|nr:serine/threonine-protein phosphatase [Solirubrobacterales bacterium]
MASVRSEPRLVSRSGRVTAAESAATPARSARWPFWLAIGVLAVGLVVTGVLAWVSYALYNRDENRLLDLRVQEVGLLITDSLPNEQTPLASAAALADATNGNLRKFTRFVTPYVGAAAGSQFNSVSLWRLRAPESGPVAVVGGQPALAAAPARARAFFDRAARTSTLSVIGLLQSPLPRLGYAYAAAMPGPYAAYGERALPSDRRSRLESNSAFSDLDYAIYLGVTEKPADLLVTSLSHLPVTGRKATERVPFGDTVLTLVVAPRQPLAGAFPQRLPWIIAIVGVILAVGAAALTVRLIQRRRSAEDLAERLERALAENQWLYAEQRSIAHTLQHALLPEDLPQIQGVEARARYEPGERGMEIGGDWYDLIPLDDHRLLMVVGDVTGRGLRAAATMASLRYAIHAYAAQNDSPAIILSKLSKLLNVTTDGQLATVLCAVIDVGARQVTVTNAGHLPPLLISGDRGDYVDSEIGLPIGVQEGAAYQSTTVSAPPAATFLAFTDGLVERRGETLDRGLARLREAATVKRGGLNDLLSQIVTQLRHEASDDDTAIVGLRWSD